MVLVSGERMDTNISSEIAGLAKLSRQQLLELWWKVYKKPAPAGFRREFLIPFISYRIQEIAYGGLKPATRSELRRIARGLEKDYSAPPLSVRSKAKRGTRFVRVWRGETHEATAVASGYEYRGKSYRSLSHIARLITGTQWSGPAFFGLRKKNPSDR